jgi:IS30 family transposase
VSRKDVKRLERKLNNTPRKILHYQTPKEVFDKIVALPH